MKYIAGKKQILILTAFGLVSLVFLFAFEKNTKAAINPLLDFQGKVIESDGGNVSNGVYDFEFAIYDDSVGGNLLWSEERTASTSFRATITGVVSTSSSLTYSYTPIQATSTLRVGQYLSRASSSDYTIITDFDSAANQISVASGSAAWSIGDEINNRPRVDGGVVMLNLGAVSDLSILDFNSPMYLETTFDGELMQPRRMFNSVSQSFNTSLLDGRAESEFAALDDDEIVTGQWSFTDILDVSVGTSSTALSITQNGSGDLIEISNASGTAFSVLNDGRVAIGAYVLPANDGFPGYVLKSDGSGNVSWEVDLAGFGGSGLWATSSNNRIIRPVDTSQIVVVGNTATSSSGYIFEVDGSSLFDQVSLSDENEFRFYDAGNTNYFALKASSTMGSNMVFTLPTNSYSDEDSLMVDTSGNMYWGKRAGLWESSGSDAYYTQGNISIGTSTSSGLLTIGATAGSQFIVNNSGQISSGEWLGENIAVNRGGTSRSSWAQYAIPYLTSSSTFGEIGIGTQDYLLGVNSGGDGYSWVDPDTVGTNLTVEQVEDIAGSLVSTTTGAQNLISILYNDASSSMDFIVEADLSQYDNSTSQFFSTSTDVLDVAYGGTGTTTFQANSLLYAQAQDIIGEVLQGSNGYILQSVSGVPTWVSTSSLGIDFNAIGGTLDPAQGGTGQDTSSWTGLPFVNGGTWMATSVLAVEYGGTGSSSLNNLITLGTHTVGDYLANATGTGSIIVTGALGEGVTRVIDILDDSVSPTELVLSGDGNNGQILTSDGSGGFSWVNQGSVGTDTTLSREQVEDFAGPLIATTTGNHSLISITYDDANNNMDFVVNDDLSQYDNSTSSFITTAGISSSATGLSYDSGTGVFSLTAGYEIPSTTSTSDWQTAFLWGDHSNQNYFDVDTDILGIAQGGTGSSSLNNLITLGTHTVGDYLANATGTGSIIVTGALGEGVTRVIDILDDSVTPTELAVSGDGTSGYILTSDGSGGFNWTDSSGVGVDTRLSREQVEDFAGSLIATTTGNHDLITITYDDNNGNMDFVVNDDLSQYDNSTSSFITTAGITNSVTGLTYDSGTGTFSLTAGYEIPGTTSTSDWQTAFSWGDHSQANYFSTSTDILGIAYGGTGSSTATGARANLGLGDLAIQDNINNDDWLGTDLAVANGGTGQSSWTQYAIPYLTDPTTFGEVGIGASGTLLQVNATGDGYTWSPAGDVGVDTTLDQEEVEDFAGGMIGTTSLISVIYNDDLDGKIEYLVENDLSLFDNSISQFFSTTTDILDLAYGGTGAVSAAGARANLGLEEAYRFGINSTGTDGQIWQSDGDGRGQWVPTSTLGIAGPTGVSKFVGTTTLTTDGAFATSTLVGYQAGNQMCDDEFPGSHMCRTYDMLVSIEQNDISAWGGTAWVAEGPPGYTSNSNDCQGWTANTNNMLGAFWALDSNGGGMGWLTNCAVSKPLACCRAD